MAHETGNEPSEDLTDLGHLASAVGHHVINAFSAVVSNAEILRLLAETDTPVDPITVADQIIRSAVEAAGVARRLIDFTRPVTAVGDTLVALDPLIAEVVEARRAGAPSGVEFETELAPLPAIKGHSQRLREMLGLLLDNAQEALPPDGGRITIRTRVDERGWVVLDVEDNGAGMTAAVQERAVEPFFTTKSGRLGVGLPIANGIWRRHRGTLAVRSRLGEGTRVRLCVEPGIAT
jgi:two-component system NtrC family sensor kinase